MFHRSIAIIVCFHQQPKQRGYFFYLSAIKTNNGSTKTSASCIAQKKWGEYVLEFLMLFLAVFLGFVAENIREHIAEHNRAKEYAISLVQDLQHDTTAINVQSKSGRIY